MPNPIRPGVNWLGARRKFIAYIDGAQPGALTVPITQTRQANYTASGATDDGADASRFYTGFIIQCTTTNARDVTVEVSVDGSTWVTCPTGVLNGAASATITAGTGIPLFVTLPSAGLAVRLVVAQPQAATDFTITVLLDNTHVRYDPKR